MTHKHPTPEQQKAKFAPFLVAPKATLGQRYTVARDRVYRDARGEQTETFTVLFEITGIEAHRLSYTVIDITDIVNPYEFFSRETSGEIMGFAFNRDVAAGRYVKVPYYRAEFPDFPEADMPAIPAGFVDVSWGNDGCPMFRDEASQLTIQVDYAAPEMRAGYVKGLMGSARFALIREDWEGAMADADRAFLYEGDSWEELLAAIKDHN